MTKRLEGKTAIITGAAAGFGLAMTKLFAIEGAEILAVDVNSDVKKLPNELEGKIVPYIADISNQESVAHIFARCKESFGKLDILCNNAGISSPMGNRIHEYPIEVFDKVLSINLRGTYMVLQGALKMMLENGGGSVINTGSMAGFRATPEISAYSASKGALNMITKQAAIEYVKDNIRVNSICPGTFATSIGTETASPELIEMLEARIPMGRLGRPEEMASFALFLASDESSYITGQNYIIDGGRSAQ